MRNDNELCTRTVTCTLRTKKQKHVTFFASPSLLAKYHFFIELLLSTHLAVAFFIVPLFTPAFISTSGCHVNVTIDSKICKKGYSLKTSEI